MSQIEIEKLHPIDTFPMAVNFLNGYSTDQFGSHGCCLFDCIKTDSKALATDIEGIVYSGEEDQEEHGRTYTLIHNRKTGKARLIESSVANLKPVLKMELTSELLETTALELSREFGSKKQKQRMEHREKLKVNVQTVTEQMQNVTQEISEDVLDLSSYNKNNSDDFYVPPIDRNATTADKVYDINNILTEEQYDKIYSELEGKDYQSEMLPLVKSITKKSLSPKLTVLAVYANSLIQIYNNTAKEITKKCYTVCPHSVTLNSLIITKFTDVSNGRKTRPGPFKDKSLCHAIVFLLLINNLKIEMDPLCEAIKMTPTTVSNKVRVTGASVVTVDSRKWIQLKIPLNKSTFKRRSAKF